MTSIPTNKGASKAKILIVDDHAIVREGVAQLVNREPDLDICYEVGDAESALHIIAERRPALAIVDVSLGSVSGFELIRKIRQKAFELPILVVSMHDEAHYAERALRAGAQGYLMKREATGKLIAAIRQLLHGEIYLSEPLKHEMLRRVAGGKLKVAPSGVHDLTDKELEILRMIGSGRSTTEIAQQLHRSVKTINAHRANLKDKLGLKNASELAVFAARWLEADR